MFLVFGTCFGFLEVFLDSGTCFGFWDVFWILGSIFGFCEVFLDSGKCFRFWEVFYPYMSHGSEVFTHRRNIYPESKEHQKGFGTRP